MSLSDAQALVRAFHERFGSPAPALPLAGDTIDLQAHHRRLDWIDSELDEAVDALCIENVADLADAYIDIIYFALGGLVELGIDGGPLFEAVHAANMQKIKLPGVAKIAKPPGWQAPDIVALIAKQREGR